ncbi:MAG: hypothetical protein V3U76_12235 [Granulosicoccus sp.]
MRQGTKRYGIAVCLPKNDPFAAPHLLGESWTGERWYDSAKERDSAMQQMLKQPGNYRNGDFPSVELTRIE